MMRAWRHRDRCRTPEAPAAWVKVIARREALRAYGASSQREVGTDMAAAAAEGDQSQRVADRVDVLRAMATLDDLDRVILHRHYWHDETTAQVAQQLDMPVGTVKVRLFRARRRLRQRLEGA